MVDGNGSQAGVQELIARIRDEGVRAGNDEAARILDEARAEAERVVSEARAEADLLRQQTRTEIETERATADEALRMASRDTVLNLMSRVTSGFKQHVRRLVTTVTRDEEVLKALVLVLAGRAVEDLVQDKEIQVMVSERLFGNREAGEMTQDERESILGFSGEMLREGVELIPASDVHGGARVRLVGENLEIDLTDEAVSSLLLNYLLPRFRVILEGTD